MGIATAEEQANIAYLESVRSPIKEEYETETSKVEEATHQVILPFLEGNPNDFMLNAYGIPKLQREQHATFLKKVLGDYPAQFAAMDAARPWILYWGLQSMTALGLDIHPYQKKCVDPRLLPLMLLEDLNRIRLTYYRVAHTFSLIQHPTGGYGGGYGQLPHLACTYAGILSLAMAGGTVTYESINRKTMWHFLGRMKQADGGFTMCEGGEEDIRGAFCALVVLSLLNLPLDLPPDAPTRQNGFTSFTDGLGAWITTCQSWDGGISAAPGNEAHGAYAFCGLGCLSILGPPTETLPKYLDIPLLIKWLSSRQCTPEGGYNGRTNKLVDGCYSHWVGSCWSLVEAATPNTANGTHLWNRSALARYILAAGQDRKGGLKDKPGKSPDAYHTCYNLAGLSAAQNKYVYDPNVNKDIGKDNLGAPYHWKTNLGYEQKDVVWDPEDVVRTVHPVFIIPYRSVYECRRHFESAGGVGES